MTISQFQQKILRWYQKNRRDIPWRRTRDPYKILVSEVMLQQTQVSRVTPKYKEFLKAFPNVKALAKSSTPKLLKTWQGLGYWRRALFLRETARMIQKKYGGKFPHDPALLEELPGIGPYTARAVACFAFQNPDAFIDTNIRRIYLHYFFQNRRNVSDKEILEIAQKAVDNLYHSDGRIRIAGAAGGGALFGCREWHYALFDYGATILADANINRRSRHYHKQSPFEGSFRFFRTMALKFLLSKPRYRAAKKEFETFIENELRGKKSLYTPSQIIASLKKDGLVRELTKYVCIV